MRRAVLIVTIAAVLAATGCGQDLADEQIDRVEDALCDLAAAGGSTLENC